MHCHSEVASASSIRPDIERYTDTRALRQALFEVGLT